MFMLKKESFKEIREIANAFCNLEKIAGRTKQAEIKESEKEIELIKEYRKDYKREFKPGQNYIILVSEPNHTGRGIKWATFYKSVKRYDIEFARQTECYIISAEGTKIKKDNILCVVK